MISCKRKGGSTMRKFSSLIIVIIAVICFIIWDVSEHKQSEPAAKALQLENEKTDTVAEDAVPAEITFDNGRGESFNVPLSSIPDFKNYLDEATDIQTELERTQVEFLDWNSSNNHYFVLKYGCGNKMCDLVLIQITELHEVKTIYLANGIFTGSKASEEKAMVRIAENEGSTVLRHQIIIVDLKTMTILHPVDKNDEESYFNSPLYPITEFKWMTADTIELIVADIPDTTYESIEKWFTTTNPPVKHVKITIE